MVTKKKVIKKEPKEIEPLPDDTPTLLTAQLDNSLTSSNLTMDTPVNIKEIYTEIENILMEVHKEKKSNLIGDNVKGIIIANWFNTFLERSFGGKEFRLDILDELIDDKLTYIISLDKTGLTELLKGISSLSPQITALMPPTLIEKLSGLPDDKRLR
jgi:hypothetical protein